MRYIYRFIAKVEQGDDLASIIEWINRRTDMEINLDGASQWVHDLRPGHLIVLNPIPKGTGVFRLNANPVPAPKKKKKLT